MGNKINKIQDGFYISGVQALTPVGRLKELGIKCVLNAADWDLYNTDFGGGRLEDRLKEIGMDVCIVEAEDSPHYNLSQHFNQIAEFIEVGRAKGGVVVHCAAGVSRASTSCCAYLMIKEHWSLNAAYSMVHGVRSCCRPNPGFWRQLRNLEASLTHQGVELRPLPSDWVFPEQLEAEEDGEDRETWSQMTADNIIVMDQDASVAPAEMAALLAAPVKMESLPEKAEMKRIQNRRYMPGQKATLIVAAETTVGVAGDPNSPSTTSAPGSPGAITIAAAATAPGALASPSASPPADACGRRYLTAVAVPAEGTSTKQLAVEIVNTSLGGVVWNRVKAEAGQVNIRAGLVPTLDTQKLRMFLAKVPGVASVIVEGCKGEVRD